MTDDPGPYFHRAEVSRFLVILQEATRARPDHTNVVYVPPVNADRATAEYHHLIFGQRGSGKSTLMRKLQADRQAKQQLAVWVDQEVFSNLAFPDVLVSTVEALFDGVLKTVDRRVAFDRKQVKWWKRPWSRTPKTTPDLHAGLLAVRDNLRTLKFAPLTSSVEWTREQSATSSAELAGKISLRPYEASGKSSKSSAGSVQSKETVVSSKSEYLERALPDFKSLLTRSAKLVGGGAIFVDDLYHLDTEDQPRVLGYLHRLVKDTGFWLKIGSIRYLTQTYTSGRQPTGMQVGQDAHLIALDDGMQRLQISTRWLDTILRKLAPLANVSIDDLFNEGSLQRLALASGCIARDYLTIAGAAIEEARNRPSTTKTGMHRVTVEDVNRAAAVLAPAKLDDMQKDAPEEAVDSRLLINQLTDFCRQTHRAYFLVDANDRKLIDRMELLRHLRFAHLLERSETVKSIATQRYDVWLLDVSQLAAQRATQQMDFAGWQDREKRRSRTLIFAVAGGAHNAEPDSAESDEDAESRTNTDASPEGEGGTLS